MSFCTFDDFAAGKVVGQESDGSLFFCRSCDKASSDDDVRQLLNLSVVYELPFGAGKRYLSSPGAARAPPWNQRIGTSRPGAWRLAHPPGGSVPSDWINKAAFAVPANQTFGNLGRNGFRAPGISQIDMVFRNLSTSLSEYTFACAPIYSIC